MKEYFFSVTTLFDMLVVFETEGININDIDFTSRLKQVTTVTFFSYTAVTFEFSVFTEILLYVEVTLEFVFEQFEFSGIAVCFGPGALFENDLCTCSLDLTELDSETKTCGCISGGKTLLD